MRYLCPANDKMFINKDYTKIKSVMKSVIKKKLFSLNNYHFRLSVFAVQSYRERNLSSQRLHISLARTFH